MRLPGSRAAAHLGLLCDRRGGRRGGGPAVKTERVRPGEGVSRESGERGRFDPAPACELQAGTIVADKYRVKSVLGRGGFAVVYDAEHLGLGRDVALKVLHRSEGTPHVLIE